MTWPRMEGYGGAGTLIGAQGLSHTRVPNHAGKCGGGALISSLCHLWVRNAIGHGANVRAVVEMRDGGKRRKKRLTQW